MDLFDAISNRHSYRGPFTAAPVPRGDLQRMVQAGIQAPSGCNEQVVSFVIVDDPHLLRQIAEIVDKPVCRSAKAMIVCVTNPRSPTATSRLPSRTARRQWKTCSWRLRRWATPACGSTGLAGRGPGRGISRLLGVPPEWTVRILLPVGVPAEPGRQKEKLPFHHRAWFNHYGGAD